MKVFLDTNVLLDVLVRREPHCIAASEIWSRVEKGALDGHISAISFNNVYYVLRRIADRSPAAEGLRLLRDVFHVVSLDERIIHSAMDSEFADFEDAIQFFSAHRAGADFIITRNTRHFPAQPIAVVTPEEFLKTETAQ
jgi:predicted nucleic acid-binding protein